MFASISLRVLRSSLGLLSVILAAPATAHGADFKGQSVTILIGFGPGGAYDIYGRVLARHYGRFIPGDPTVVVKNMPGAGTLLVANHIYNLTGRDSTEIAMFSSSAAMEPMMGNEQAKFDTTKFGWIGSMNQEIAFCGVWRGQGIPMAFPDMIKKDSKELVFGSTGTAAVSHQYPLVLKNMLGANFRVIAGYGGNQTILAMQRGEVHGICGLFVSAIKVQWLTDVTSGRFKLFLQMGPKISTEFGAVPDVFDYISTDQSRKVLELLFKQMILGRPLATSPNLPKDRLAALRLAFIATMKDPEFLADAKKANLDIDIATSDEVERLLVDFASYPRPIIERARVAIGR